MKRWFVLMAVILPVLTTCAWAQSPAPGPNVNMVSGTSWTTGDPFLQRQNEPSVAVSTRNTSHLLAGDNDYRSVDFEELFEPQMSGEPTPDAWLGVFKSLDGGATWASTLLPGFPADSTKGAAPGQTTASPLFGLAAAADPIVRAGTNGMFYYGGIAFNRNSNVGKVFVARFIDNNNKENGNPTNLETPGLFTAISPTDPIRYLGTTVVQSGSATQFLDKPWLAVDVPRGSATCSISYTNPDGTTGTQTIPASNIYMSFSDFVNNDTESSILFTRSTNCGATWSSPIALSGLGVNQGSVVVVAPPIPGTESVLPPIIYVAWRQFGSGSTPSAIMMAVSINGGVSFVKAFAAHTFPLSCNTTPTGTGCPFDQGITDTSFRTNAYPALAADTTARTYLAWTQRQADGDARIVLQVGLLGVSPPPSFSAPALVDNGYVYDDYGNPLTNLSGRGHQVMPSLTFNAGKLMMIYYDLRQDHTIGQFTELANLTGYSETREFEGELVGDPNNAAVFNFWIQDTDPPLTVRRHTIDVQGAQATPLAATNLSAPAFSAFRIAHYQFGINPYDGSNVAEQLQVNPPNLPMFQTGTVPFMGDYIDVAGAPPFVMTSGKWHFNTGTAAGLPVFQAVWTDNRNVVPPANGNWADYTPPYSASNPTGTHNSVFDPTKTVLACNPGFVAMRNQDIYTSRIAPGLVVLVPGNQKTLGTIPNSSTLLQRAFSVVVQNTTTSQLSFRLTIANQPLLANGSVDPLGQATFVQVPATPTVTTEDVTVAALSSASRMVFVKSQNPTASVTVNVQQITQPGGTVVSGGLTSTTVINPDPTTPALINPDENPAVSNPAVSNAEVYNPAVSNPAVSNPAVSNPAVSNLDVLNPAVSNPAVSNPAVSNPAVSNQAVSAALNPAVSNATISNPAVSNPAVSNPAVSNTAVADVSYQLTNNGNTTATYSIQLFGSNPSNLLLQLILNKVYYLNEANGCELAQQPTNVILSNIPNPPIVTNPSNLGTPAVSNPAVSNATVAVPPGETVQVTLRTSQGSFTQPPTSAQLTQLTNNLTPVVVSHAVNTQNLGTPNQQPPISLTITTKSLPNGATNVAYSQQLTAIGGVGNYTWSLFSGSLPTGNNVTLSSGGLISGTPTVAGTFNFVVQVADSATPTPNVAQQPLSITVVAPLAFTPPAIETAIESTTFAENLTNYTSGGLAPYTYSISSGSTAPFSLVGSTISGTPTSPTTASFTVQVTDSESPAQTAQQAMSVQVVPPLAFALPATAMATAGTLFSESLTSYTSGGLPPYTYALYSGSTAPFTLAGSTISGTPTGAGSATFTIQVTDSLSNSQTSGQTITIVNPVVITNIIPSSAAAGIGQTVTILTTGVSDPSQATVTFTNGGTSDGGLVFLSPSAANVLYVRLPSGFPTGTASVVVTNTGTGVSSPSFPLPVSTTPGTPVANYVYGLSTAPASGNSYCGSGLSGSPITTATPGEGIVVYAYGLDTTGATVSFSDGVNTITAGSSCAYSSGLGIGAVVTVPSGLNAGTINVSIETTVSGVTSALSNPISLTLNPPLTLAPASLAGGNVGVSYPSQMLAALVSGGIPPYGNWTWTAVPISSLPPGLSLDPSAGTITGTPTTEGTYTFIVTVSDSLGSTASQTYSISIAAAGEPLIAGAQQPWNAVLAPLPTATVGTAYTPYTFTVTGGTPPYGNWSQGDTLPAGLMFSNGVLSGTATGGGFAYPYDATSASWSVTPSVTGGTTTIAPNCLMTVSVTDSESESDTAYFQVGSTPSSPCAAFSYNVNLGNPGSGVSPRTWTFQNLNNNPGITGTLSFNYEYTGHHSFFEVTAELQVFSGSTSNATTLYSAGPEDCCTTPSGGFDVTGTGSIAVTAGQPFGFIAGGSNFDSESFLEGTVYITNFSITPQP
ncbi:MAG: putative Ig domain-containing protein [Terriglobales bacterium]